MAQGIQLEREKFCCSICLDLLHEPVTIPCSHSYCMSCIKEHWDKKEPKRLYCCPQCRRRFISRPELLRNNMLEVVVEELKKTGLQAAPADHCYAGPEDVACDLCTGKRLKALKSCLQCLASYCEEHLQQHYDVGPLKLHKLVDPSPKLQESVCSKHQEVMKLFCRTDQQCICYLCSKDNHKGHNKVSAAAERTVRQSELGLTRQKIQQRIRDRERDAKMFQQEEDAINHSAAKALSNTETILNEWVRVIDKMASDIKEKIKSRKNTELDRFEKVRQKVEQEIAELRRKDMELEKLSLTEDHTYFLINYHSFTHLKFADAPSVNVHRLQHFVKVTVALLEARDKLEEVLGEEYAKITMALREVEVLLNVEVEPRTRADFLCHACQVTLDPNTANTHVSIFEDRKATYTQEEHCCSFQPERFAYAWQVLSKECLTERCYWEVEKSWRGVLVAVSYKDISRAGNFSECAFGQNEKSWALDCYKNSYEFRHNNKKTPIPGTWSSRVGVYLDHRAGVLSFYSVSDTMTLLHRVQTTFTQPLYAGLWLSDGATAELCKLK
ncbi:tripartite motif-containing protein 16-like [Channa argus]|uniref:tripartite motif-containing protein 16-like n=1 Tax=Channa argus TaxID=215402 RepID=UPI003521CE8F